MNEMKIKKLWFADGRIYVTTDKGETLFQSLKFYPRLLTATDEQRQAYELWEYGIRWDAIDEDMSYESFYYDETKQVQSSGGFIIFSLMYALVRLLTKLVNHSDRIRSLPTS